MIERLMPIFAVIGLFSCLGYLTFAVWAVCQNLPFSKRKHG
ncbi:hypothetical protein [Neisseria sp.]